MNDLQNLIALKKSFPKRWKFEETMETFENFKTRILNDFKTIDQKVSAAGQRLFCKYYAIEDKTEYYPNGRHYSSNIWSKLKEETDPFEFIRLLEVILNLPFEPKWQKTSPNEASFHVVDLFQSVVEAIILSELPVKFHMNKDATTISYPAGEKFLDEGLIDSVLSFLNKESNKHFITALDCYKKKNYIQAAEHLRRALEEYLKFKFHNTECLQNNIPKVDKFLQKTNNSNHREIRTLIHQFFDRLDKYFNNNSKHNDGPIGKSEIEFLIYQTALLMRYFDQVYQDQPSDTEQSSQGSETPNP